MGSKILIINGPNLNLLGVREPSIYGAETFESFLAQLQTNHPAAALSYFQSNIEGELINKIQEAGFGAVDGIILNAAAYTNSIGATELAAAWTDPDFDPAQDAFYYARVLEIPTPRWSTYDAARFGVERPADVPAETRERAYSSPIWYTPER